jgi:hypothetical protein
MAEMHASSSGLKSLCTIFTADAIEQCRRACGGHGFSSASGLGSQYQDFLPCVPCAQYRDLTSEFCLTVKSRGRVTREARVARLRILLIRCAQLHVDSASRSLRALALS